MYVPSSPPCCHLQEQIPSYDAWLEIVNGQGREKGNAQGKDVKKTNGDCRMSLLSNSSY